MKCDKKMGNHMKNISIKFLIVIMIFLYSNLSFAMSKKEALYQDGKELHEWSQIAGKWVAWMKSCMGNGKFAQQIKEEVAKLSWPDFKVLGSGETVFESRFIAGKCVDSEVKAGKGYLRRYTRELSNLVKDKTNKSLNSNSEKKRNALIYCQKSNDNVYTSIHGTCVPDKKISKEEYLEIKNENKIKKEQNEDIETKLMKLKSLFEKKLITKEEYDQKRKEILDEM